MSDDTKDKAEKVMASIVGSTQHLWAQNLYNEAMRDLVMFGTTHPHIYKKTTLWERIKWFCRKWTWRVQDAWKVLTGKAEIYDGD